MTIKWAIRVFKSNWNMKCSGRSQLCLILVCCRPVLCTVPLRLLPVTQLRKKSALRKRKSSVFVSVVCEQCLEIVFTVPVPLQVKWVFECFPLTNWWTNVNMTSPLSPGRIPFHAFIQTLSKCFKHVNSIMDFFFYYNWNWYSWYFYLFFLFFLKKVAYFYE